MEITILAAVVSFVLTLLIGRFLIPELRKLKAGQEIREDGPTWHAGKAGTPDDVIVAAGLAVEVVLQCQKQQHAVVPLRGADPQTGKFLLGIAVNGFFPGGGDHLHGNLSPGLRKERLVHGVDVGAGLVRQDALPVQDIRVTALNGGGGGGIVRGLFPLSDPDADGNHQHHDQRRRGAFLK